MRARRFVRVLAAAVVTAVAGAPRALAQISATPVATFEGAINYVVTGTSLRQSSNAVNACSVASSGSASLSGIPAGAKILGAYLYWAGSGPLDQSVNLRGNLTADRTWTRTYNNGGQNLTFFGAFENVTSSVAGNGNYTLTGLSVTANGNYCSSQAVIAGWSLFVVYADASQPLRRIEVRDGFLVLRNDDVSITLDGFLGAQSPGARVTLLSWEGDEDISGGEEVRVNGTTVSTPAGNAFNNTISSQGRSNSYGHDLDTYDASARVTAGDRTATIQVAAGADLILAHALITSVDIQLVDVTPKGLATPVARLGGTTRYSQTFQVQNVSDSTRQFDLVARATGTPSPFITIDWITGPGMVGARLRADSLRVSIARRTTQSYQVWYRVVPGGLADNVVFLLARAVAFPTRTEARSEGWQEIRRGVPALALAKSVTPNANVAPGMDLTYQMVVSNTGSYAATGIVVRDEVPALLDFRVGSVTQTLPGGVTAAQEYSSDGGTTWTYTPVSGGCGAPANYDRCVKAVRWRLTGSLAPNGAQTATLRFIARVR